MSPTAFRWFPILLLLLPLSAPVFAQAPESNPTAAELFEQTLEAEGLDAAVAVLKEVLDTAIADSVETYAIDAYELGIGLPTRLVLRRERSAALELVKTIEPLFGEHPRYFQELGLGHLRCGHAEEARAAFTRAAEMNDNRPDLLWIVEHMDELVAVQHQQAELEGRFKPGEPTGLHGPYLGQKPPGPVPEVFAPGILNTVAHEYHISFAPDGREIVFSRSGVGSLITRWMDDGWTMPEVIHFIDEDHLTEEANHTGDGEAIVFCGRADVKQSRDLYRAERDGDGWGEPVMLFPGMYGSTARDGSLYYTAHGEGRDYGAIVVRRLVDGAYGEPVVVPGEGINSDEPDAHPWISPDGNLLLFDTYRNPGMGIYAAFRLEDGSWSAAAPLCERLGIPPVGQTAMSHDGKYLFFCLAGDMYWVDAGFLDEMRPENAKR